MTATQPVVEWATPAEREAAARQLYRRHVAEGERLTGADLGALFGRSARWGRYRIAEARRYDTSDDPAEQDAADPSGSAPLGNGSRNGTTRNGGGHKPAVGTHAGDGQSGVVDQTRPDGSNVTTDGSHDVSAAAAPASTDGHTPVGPSPAVRATTELAVSAVAVVAAVVSFEHQRYVAVLAGEGWRSWLLPISVDGLVVAASMCLLTARRSHQPPGALAVVALLLGLGASLTARSRQVRARLNQARTTRQVWVHNTRHPIQTMRAAHRKTQSPAQSQQRRRSPGG